MARTSADVIVLGLGGVGSAALFELARRGASVIGIDRFDPPHDRGSSHGETRLIRLVYLEHPDYVPLLRRAYERWAELEARSGASLYTETGLLQVGPREGSVMRGLRETADRHGLDVELLDRAEAADRFPGFRIPDGCAALFDPNAGLLRVEACVAAHRAEAERLGARAVTGEVVRGWRSSGGGVEVTTARDTYRADRLVVAAGAWAPELLRHLEIPLEIRRKSLFWFGTDDPRYALDRGCPAFLFQLPDGVFYGFPAHGPHGLKLGEHTGGRPVPAPLELDRVVDADEERAVRRFLDGCLPGVGDRRTRHAVCMYTMTPDEHFALGLHPRHENVSFAAGLSGHGFKFTGVLGEVLADLALDGVTRQPVGFLSPTRFGL